VPSEVTLFCLFLIRIITESPLVYFCARGKNCANLCSLFRFPCLLFFTSLCAVCATADALWFPLSSAGGRYLFYLSELFFLIFMCVHAFFKEKASIRHRLLSSLVSKKGLFIRRAPSYLAQRNATRVRFHSQAPFAKISACHF
jgi:hypothetical protein